MTSILGVIALGFFLGMRHATDPDHVIAVTTIVSRQRTALNAAAIGAAWGIGHTCTILVVGGAIIVFGWVIPPRVGLSTELAVGVMLIALGVMNLTGVMRRIRSSVNSHAHCHDDYAHPHDGDATPLRWLDRHFGSLGGYRLVRPLVVGVVHGLAGSAALALLVLATISSPGLAIAYLVIFGLGTILGMMLMTAVIVLPFAYAENRFARASNALRLASGTISVVFGIFIAYRIGIVAGLFTSHPHWTPQ